MAYVAAAAALIWVSGKRKMAGTKRGQLIVLPEGR